ncbi:WYL domain-containing protein [Proteus mirabilis]|uniref:WYL domain-containing protein n=1 Tax=Proteus mirabilis TaxID=584 RepID=UPI000A987C6D|nr:WYL domain-containing protein [Proteus mirabilis]MDD8914935.1 WYL domain-containing protein [Escherichia coli]MDM3645133.1 WYL domain-containing protein [Proteus mirabilis]
MAVYRHASCGDYTRMTGNTERRLLAPNHQCYWQQIATEIQRYGVNTLMSLGLLRQGVAYWNILEDVCDKLDVNYNVKSSTEAIELTLLMKLLEKNLDQMAQEELATFSRNIQPDLTNPTPQLIIMVVQTALRTSFFSINDFQHFWLGLPSHHTGLHYRDLTLSATYFPLIHFLPTAGWSGYFLQGAFIMPKQEHRYDRLAIRLAILVSRLFMGESLNISQLAQEFGVSGRTVQRDLRERLRYLDTEYIDGHVSLRDARGPFRTNSDILRFAQITSVAHYFPVLDPKLLSVLLDNRQDPPCIVWNDPPRQAPALFDGFQVIVQSIIRNRLIRFLHHEHLQSSIAPYRLICHDGEWYLAAVSKDRIQVFTLSAITDVVMTASSFARNRHIDRILQDPRFMRALPHFDYISGIIHK